MNHLCSQILPALNVRVLLYDARFQEWKIARMAEHNGVNVWIIDPKLYFAMMSDRFTHWTELPEIPNG